MLVRCLVVLFISVTCTPSYNSKTLEHLEEAESKGKAIMLLFEPERYFAERHAEEASRGGNGVATGGRTSGIAMTEVVKSEKA